MRFLCSNEDRLSVEVPSLPLPPKQSFVGFDCHSFLLTCCWCFSFHSLFFSPSSLWPGTYFLMLFLARLKKFYLFKRSGPGVEIGTCALYSFSYNASIPDWHILRNSLCRNVNVVAVKTFVAVYLKCAGYLISRWKVGFKNLTFVT